MIRLLNYLKASVIPSTLGGFPISLLLPSICICVFIRSVGEAISWPIPIFNAVNWGLIFLNVITSGHHSSNYFLPQGEPIIFLFWQPVSDLFIGRHPEPWNNECTVFVYRLTFNYQYIWHACKELEACLAIVAECPKRVTISVWKLGLNKKRCK